jgi:hypothetical protein
VHAFMIGQRQRFALGDIEPLPWSSSLASTVLLHGAAQDGPAPEKAPAPAAPPAGKPYEPWLASKESLSFLLNAPMKTCLFCRALHQDRRCRYRNTVLNSVWKDEALKEDMRAWLESTLAAEFNLAAVQAGIGLLAPAEKRLASVPGCDGAVYCFAAHLADGWQHDPQYAEQSNNVRKITTALLSRLEAAGVKNS